MDTTSINSMWSSFQTSIPALKSMVTGFAYVLGVAFILYSISQLHDLADRHTKQNVKGGIFEPIAYLLCGSILLWLPTWIGTFEVTLFGSTSPLAYSGLAFNNIAAFQSLSNYAIVETLQLVGLVFFVRGVSLMALSSDPGVQHGMRGLVFTIVGILTINFPATFEMVQSTISTFVSNPHTLFPIHQTAQSLLSGQSSQSGK